MKGILRLSDFYDGNDVEGRMTTSKDVGVTRLLPQRRSVDFATDIEYDVDRVAAQISSPGAYDAKARSEHRATE